MTVITPRRALIGAATAGIVLASQPALIASPALILPPSVSEALERRGVVEPHRRAPDIENVLAMLMMAKMMPGVGASGPAAFVSYQQTITTTGNSTIAAPPGATTVTVELIAAGSSGVDYFDGTGTGSGGGGGAYSKRNAYSLSGVTDVYVVVPAGNAGNAVARANNSGGTVIAEAQGRISNPSGGDASNGTGDVKYSGGAGNTGATADNACRGGGAAGPTGNGQNGTRSQAGIGGGSPAGQGGGGTGQLYGGGGSVNTSNTVFLGAQGWCRLTWA